MDNKNYKGLIVKLCCFIASFSLWVYISSVYDSKKTDVIYNVPVEIIGAESLQQEKLILLPEQDVTADLKVEGDIKLLTKVKKEDFSLYIDLSEYVEGTELTKGVLNAEIKVEEKPSDITIVDEKNLSKELEVDDYVEKSIAVNVNQVDISDTDISITKIEANPKKIKINGAKTYVDKVAKVEASLTYANIIEGKLSNIEVTAKDKKDRVITEVTLEKNQVDIEVTYDNIKKVKISPNVIGKLPNGLELNEIRVNASMVKISGDKDVLDNIKEITTESINLSKIDKDTTRNVDLKTVDGVKIIDPTSVEVEVLVKTKDIPEKDLEEDDNKTNPSEDTETNPNENTDEEIIEKQLTLKVLINNLPQDLVAELASDTVKVTISGKKSIIDTIKETNFNCYIDGSILTTESTSAEVVVTGDNSEITIKSILPQSLGIKVKNKNIT